MVTIYLIRPTVPHDDCDKYIGSTSKRLCDRMSGHRYGYRKWKEGVGDYVTVFDIFEKYGLDKIEIIELECGVIQSERYNVERFYIETIDCVNKNIPSKSRTERYYEQHNRFLERGKIYREQNADKNKERHKIYREQNADKIKERQKIYREQNADKMKKYREENADKIKESGKIYREQNADKIREKKRLAYLKKKNELLSLKEET